MAIVKAIDVADYILDRMGAMSAMKLQKLVYYSQAWSLAWTEKPLFNAKIQAWVNGPVVRSLYDLHKGHFRVTPGFFDGDPSALSLEQTKVVKRVLKFYGKKDPQWLSDLTHMEAPWRKARKGLEKEERGEREITRESMLEYYSSL